MADRIESIETIRPAAHPNLLWIQVGTAEGLTGLGETFSGAAAAEAYIHETLAPAALGKDPSRIEGLSQSLAGYLGFSSAGAEMRGRSAFDIALWDILGKRAGLPVAQMLGGFTRDRIRVYNTCAGATYMRSKSGQQTGNYGLDADRSQEYDDLNGFLDRANEVAISLLEDGVTAMKIWPFDAAAEKTGGIDISAEDLKAALVPFERIRAAAGDRMEIMVEFHSMWKLTPAIRIARALEPYGTFWHEDPIKMDSLKLLRRYAQASPAPVCASETLAGLGSFKDLLESESAGVIMLDVSWCGGLTQARKIAAMAEAWQLPIAPHDCTGPVALAASTHLSLSAPNALIQETVRAYYRTWYRDLVTSLPPIEKGFITVPDSPGLGLELNPDLDRMGEVSRKVSLLGNQRPA